MAAGFDREEEFWRPQYLDGETKPGVYHAEWRAHLNSKNKERVNELRSFPIYSQRFGLYSRVTAQFFEKSCNFLEMPPDVLCIAHDLYDRFWLLYLCCVKKNWTVRDGNVKKEACLTAMTCIQLATKLCCHGKVLTISTIVQWLKSIGHDVEKKEVLASEIRVLTTIDFIMPTVTLLTYVEMFFEEMSELFANLQRSELLLVATEMVKVAMAHHKEIYLKLHLAFKKRAMETIAEKVRFLYIEGDYIRLAASVVCAAASFYEPTGHLSASVAQHLSNTTKYAVKEIWVLSAILKHVILRDIVKAE